VSTSLICTTIYYILISWSIDFPCTTFKVQKNPNLSHNRDSGKLNCQSREQHLHQRFNACCAIRSFLVTKEGTVQFPPVYLTVFLCFLEKMYRKVFFEKILPVFLNSIVARVANTQRLENILRFFLRMLGISGVPL
jgi:hypothetical protein